MDGTRRIPRLTLQLLTAGIVALAGCVAAAPVTGPEDPSGAGSKEDRWDEENNPTNFTGLQLKRRLADLPREGRSAHIAWPSTYWPLYRDAINDRWNGKNELSPAEKYDVAFNGWTPPEGFMSLRPYDANNCEAGWDATYYQQLGPLAKYVSDFIGNTDARDGVDSDDDNHDGTYGGEGDKIDECDDRDGVEGWFGLCHAWVPAALLEDRPLHSVVHNGVTFHTADLEALIIQAYHRNRAQMIGGRCNDGHGIDGQPGEEVERDEFGRPTNTDCVDTNAGTWHVIASNYLGIGERPFAEDRTYDYQVWNQPVVAFKVENMEEITIARANELLGLTGDTYRYNADAKQLFYTTSTSTYITESGASTIPADPAEHERSDRYEYILEIDANGDIIGGEWVGSSRGAHPDFLWNPSRLSQASVPHLDIEKVRMLIGLAREPVTPPTNAREFPGQGGIAIPDNSPTGAAGTLEITESLSIQDLQVAVEITHSYVGDLTVTLEHNNTVVTLHNREGGAADNINRTFPAAQFVGQNAQGNWRLNVVDSAGADVGTLVSWKLIVVPRT